LVHFIEKFSSKSDTHNHAYPIGRLAS